jgi:hypothetical protein
VHASTTNERPGEVLDLTVVDEGEERLLDQQLRVEDDQLGGGRNEIIALVEFEELDEYLRFILF